MSKEFKRCPRCNFKTPNDMARCGNCGLNFVKFDTATNTEAKNALRIGEKERVLNTKHVPSDINKWEIFLLSLFGGWFGLHYFKIGRKWRGLFQVLGVISAFIYGYFMLKFNIRVGFISNVIFGFGVVWLVSFITWFSDTISIAFNRFKYPVSLPYSHNVEKLDDVKFTDKEHKKQGE